MDLRNYPEFEGHEAVERFADPAVGLTAYIAVHNTVLGPGLGGIRMKPYPTEEAAVRDVMRLSAAMTRKNALAGIPYGGGKAVIIGDPATDKTPDLFQAMGWAVAQLNGTYVAAGDAGVDVADLDEVRKTTRLIGGCSLELGSSGDSGTMTALGVLCSIIACLQYLDGYQSVGNRKIAVMGAGKVGLPLIKLLAERDAIVVFADPDAKKRLAVLEAVVATTARVSAVAPEAILEEECDVFSPCAYGGILNETTIPALRCRAIAGGANNQLAAPDDGTRLMERGILYAPDYVANAGGVINIAQEFEPGGYRESAAQAKTMKIYNRLLALFIRATNARRPTSEIAEAMVQERLAEGRKK